MNQIIKKLENRALKHSDTHSVPLQLDDWCQKGS